MAVGNDKVSIEILMLEKFDSGKLEAIISQSLSGILIGVKRIPIEELAGVVCKGEVKLEGFESSSTLLKTYSKVALGHYEIALFGKRLMICEIANTETNAERQYLVLDEVYRFDIMTKTEAEKDTFLNAFKGNDDDFYFSVGIRKVPKYMFHSKGETNAISIRSKNLREFISFKSKPFINGRVIVSNKFNPVLVNCHLMPTKSFIQIPKYISEISSSGLSLNEGFYRRLEFTRFTTIRPNSIFAYGNGSRIGTLIMTCEQMADSRLAFLQDGKVTVKKLVLQEDMTDLYLRTYIDVIRSLYSYISTDWLFNEEEMPAVMSKTPILEVEWVNHSNKDFSDSAYTLVAEIAKDTLIQMDKLIAELDLSPDNPDLESFTEYAETLIGINTKMIGTVYPELLQPFCSQDLILSADYSLERLASLFQEYLHELLN